MDECILLFAVTIASVSLSIGMFFVIDATIKLLWRRQCETTSTDSTSLCVASADTYMRQALHVRFAPLGSKPERT